MTALVKTPTRAADNPLAADLAEIDRVWGEAGWFVRAHEEVLRDDPDVVHHEQKRALAKAIAEARAAELRAALLARSAR